MESMDRKLENTFNDIDTLDVNNFFNTETTSVVRITSNHYADFFIYENDLIIVDSSIKPHNNARVLVSMNGVISIKIFRIINNTEFIQSNNFGFFPLSIGNIKFEILGTITAIMHPNKGTALDQLAPGYAGDV